MLLLGELSAHHAGTLLFREDVLSRPQYALEQCHGALQQVGRRHHRLSYEQVELYGWRLRCSRLESASETLKSYLFIGLLRNSLAMCEQALSRKRLRHDQVTPNGSLG